MNGQNSNLSQETHYCMICNQIFTNGNQLINHFIEKHSNNQAPAPTLPTAYTPTHLPKILPKIANAQVLKVQEMKDVLIRAGNEIIGEVIIPQSGRRKLKCKDCDFIHENMEFLISHRDVHRITKVKGYKCHKCDFVAKEIAVLKAHTFRVQENIKFFVISHGVYAIRHLMSSQGIEP